MLTTARVDLPAPVSARLISAASFSDSVNDIAREDLVSFKRPIAAAFALIAPVAFAFAYYGGGMITLAQVAMVNVGTLIVGLYFIGKQEWPQIVEKFQDSSNAKRRAIADLRCGFGEASFLSHGRAPYFMEYDHGVLVLADAGDLKTIFFAIADDDSDPRWSLYQKGELHRRVWRWLRLPVSRDVVKFSAEGSKMANVAKPAVIDSIDAWEAINVALGEPLDGAIIHRPFDELKDTVSRLV